MLLLVEFPASVDSVHLTCLHDDEDLTVNLFGGVHPETRWSIPEDFLACLQIELESMPRTHQDLAAAVVRYIARPTRIPYAPNHPFADSGSFVRAAVHDGAELAALQANDADIAAAEFGEFHLADREIA
jgi:hypothetical protein